MVVKIPTTNMYERSIFSAVFTCINQVIKILEASSLTELHYIQFYFLFVLKLLNYYLYTVTAMVFFGIFISTSLNIQHLSICTSIHLPSGS